MAPGIMEVMRGSRTFGPAIALTFLTAVACRPALQTAERPGRTDGAGTAEGVEMETMDDGWARKRTRMVERQIASRDVDDPRVLEVMGTVPRHRFVPPSYRSQAYDDHPLPIGHDQTISQPYIVALMSQMLELEGDESVLEVGTGSGYQAAVLGSLAREVHTMEIVAPLCEEAATRLAELGYAHVHVHCADGYRGWPDAAPFDAVMVTAAPDHVPAPLLEQLAVGGRLVIPVGPPHRTQWLTLLTKEADGEVVEQTAIPVAFVPMTGEAEEKR